MHQHEHTRHPLLTPRLSFLISFSFLFLPSSNSIIYIILTRPSSFVFLFLSPSLSIYIYLFFFLLHLLLAYGYRGSLIFPLIWRLTHLFPPSFVKFSHILLSFFVFLFLHYDFYMSFGRFSPVGTAWVRTYGGGPLVEMPLKHADVQ